MSSSAPRPLMNDLGFFRRLGQKKQGLLCLALTFPLIGMSLKQVEQKRERQKLSEESPTILELKAENKALEEKLKSAREQVANEIGREDVMLLPLSMRVASVVDKILGAPNELKSEVPDSRDQTPNRFLI